MSPSIAPRMPIIKESNCFIHQEFIFSGPNKISKIEIFEEKVNNFQLFIIFVKSAILDVLNTFWILNTVLNMSLEALTTFARSFILDVWLVFSIGRNSELNYIEWQTLRGVFEESCFGSLILSQIHIRNILSQ